MKRFLIFIFVAFSYSTWGQTSTNFPHELLKFWQFDQMYIERIAVRDSLVCGSILMFQPQNVLYVVNKQNQGIEIRWEYDANSKKIHFWEQGKTRLLDTFHIEYLSADVLILTSIKKDAINGADRNVEYRLLAYAPY